MFYVSRSTGRRGMDGCLGTRSQPERLPTHVNLRSCALVYGEWKGAGAVLAKDVGRNLNVQSTLWRSGRLTSIVPQLTPAPVPVASKLYDINTTALIGPHSLFHSRTRKKRRGCQVAGLFTLNFVYLEDAAPSRYSCCVFMSNNSEFSF